jgi:HPt (histidine-containing phosphotransfer) domain-containing protein
MRIKPNFGKKLIEDIKSTTQDATKAISKTVAEQKTAVGEGVKSGGRALEQALESTVQKQRLASQKTIGSLLARLSLSSDKLLSEFVKLQAQDPNSSPETAKHLKGSADSLRQSIQQAEMKLKSLTDPSLTQPLERLVSVTERMTQALSQVGTASQESKAEEMNDLMREQADIIQLILESKNKGLEAVVRMLQQNFAAASKLQAAAASRGG